MHDPMIVPRITRSLAHLDDLTTGRRPNPFVLPALSLLFSLQFLAIFALKLPVSGRFECFLYYDYGANLTVQTLLDQGRKPTVDFFYPYGLLPLALGRGFFDLLGRSPHAYLAAVALCQIGLGCGLASFLRYSGAGLAGVSLAALAVPCAFPPTYPNLAHALESLFLVWALAELARGSRRNALALATAGLFCKPSMPYLLIMTLVALTFWHEQSGKDDLKRALRPAAYLGISLGLMLALLFGPVPLIRSLWPGQVAGLYESANYGFFHGDGRRFWLPDNPTIAHYLLTLRTFWIAASLFLLLAGGTAIYKFLRDPSRNAYHRAFELVAICALLHLAFVFLFFAGESSWMYYSNILILGCAASAGWSPRWRAGVLLLAALALCADRSLPREIATDWQKVGALPTIAGLWSEPRPVQDWRDLYARALSKPGKRVFLGMSGCAPMLFEGFQPSVDLFLLPGMENSLDARLRAQSVDQADIVVIPARQHLSPAIYDLITHKSPALARSLWPFQVTYWNDHFELHERVPAQGEPVTSQ